MEIKGNVFEGKGQYEYSPFNRNLTK